MYFIILLPAICYHQLCLWLAKHLIDDQCMVNLTLKVDIASIILTPVLF